MPNLKATTAIFIDKYHPKANSLCAISVRVTFERKKRYYPLPISLTIPNFEKAQSLKPREPHKAISLRLQAFEKKAADIIDELPYFTWAAFEKQFLANRSAKDTLEQAFSNYAKELRNTDRIGTAVAYECAQSSLKKFAPDARFADVTPDFLQRYEVWMLKQGNSVTTISIYLRTLRALFNNLLSDGMLTKVIYPFGKKKYEIPTGNNIKKSLTLRDIAAIYYHKPSKGTNAAMSKDYWLFMYLCNGINVKDMCLLKYENIKGDVLEFERAKTARTKRKVEPIRVVLVDDTKQIIEKWGNPHLDGSTYIFPVLTKGLSAVRERQLIQQLTGVINDHMKIIAKELGIESNLTTYVARHSFSTILQRSGASTEFISEALGHSNVKTTQNYLAGFEDESKKETVKALTAFKNNLQAVG